MTQLCPFCAGSNLEFGFAINPTREQCFVTCCSCGANGPRRENIAAAEDAWNLRANGTPAMPARILSTVEQLANDLLQEKNARARGVTTLVEALVDVKARLDRLERRPELPPDYELRTQTGDPIG